MKRPTLASFLVLMLAGPAGCILDPLATEGLGCPCAPGWTCVDEVCVRADAGVDGGAAIRRDVPLLDTPCEDGGARDARELASAELVSLPVSTLSDLRSECADPPAAWPWCHSALHTYCSTRTPGESGFPIDSPAMARGVCLEATIFATDQWQLATTGWDCRSPYVGRCFAAIHRFCRCRGYVSGFGPVTYEGDTLSVACVRGAFVMDVAGLECSTSDRQLTETCAADVHDRCVAAGAISGFGPVELGSGAGQVTCVY